MPSESEKMLSLIFAMGRRIREEGSKKKKASTTSMLHFHTLRYVQEKVHPLMNEVAAYLCVTPPAATLLIDGLVKDKLLTRVLDSKDRRLVRITLTDQGKKFIARGIKAKTDKLKKMLSVLAPKERAQFIAILEKIAKQ